MSSSLEDGFISEFNVSTDIFSLTFSLCASHSRFDNLLQLALNNSTLYSLERDSIQNRSEMVGTTNNEKVSWSVADRADKNQQRKIDDSFTSADSLSFLLRG